MSSRWDWENEVDMVKVERERPFTLEQKRQILIDDARKNLEEELDELESLTAKGTAFDDAVSETLTMWELNDQEWDRLVKAYELVRELRGSNKAEVEQKYLEHCRAIAEAEQKRAAERDETEFFNLPTAAADFSLWNRKKHWHPEEAAALSLGKNPKIVNPQTLGRLQRPDSPFVREFQESLKTSAARPHRWSHSDAANTQGIHRLGYSRGLLVAGRIARGATDLPDRRNRKGRRDQSKNSRCIL